MKSLKQLLLLEHDMDKTWEKHGEKITERLKGEGVKEKHQEFFKQKISQGDPTQNKEYGGWIAHKYSIGGINRHEDIDARVRPALETFHNAKVRKQLSPHGINADINTYKSLPDLESAVEKIPKKESKRQEAKQEADKFRAPGISTHYDEEHWHVITPHTVDAAIHYGQNTKWCTTAKNNNYFEHYNKQGPLHIFVPKKPRWNGEKYQLHMQTGQFMNEHDTPANQHPETGETQHPFEGRPSSHFNKLLDEPVNEKAADSPHGIHINYGPKEKIDQLVHSKNQWTKVQIANRGIKEHLDHLVNDDASEVRAAVARHGHKEHLDKLVTDPASNVRAEVLKNGNAEHVEKLSNDHSEDVLKLLGSHGLEHHVQSALAQHSAGTLISTPDGTREYSGLKQTIEGLASNKHISTEQKGKLVEPFLNHPEQSVSAAAFKHYHPEHWNRFLESPKGEDHAKVMNAYKSVSSERRQELKMPAAFKKDIEDKFVTHPNHDVRKDYASRTNNIAHLDKLASDENMFVRNRVANSPYLNNLSVKTQSKLAEDPERVVSSSVAQTTASPHVIDKALAKHNHPSILGSISQNYALKDQLHDIIKKHLPSYEKALSDAPIHKTVSAYDASGKKVTKTQEPDYWNHISAVVAKHTSSTAAIQDVIDKGYYPHGSYHESGDTRGNLISNKATTNEQVKQLVTKHPGWLASTEPRTVKLLAQRGIKEHLDKIVESKWNHKSDTLKAVVKHGHPEHLEALSNSDKKMVRQAVAKKAPLELAQKMKTDRNQNVASMARTRVGQLEAQAAKEAQGVPIGAVRMSRVKHGKYANEKYRQWGKEYRERKKQRLAAARNPQGNEGEQNR